MHNRYTLYCTYIHIKKNFDNDGNQKINFAVKANISFDFWSFFCRFATLLAP